MSCANDGVSLTPARTEPGRPGANDAISQAIAGAAAASANAAATPPGSSTTAPPMADPIALAPNATVVSQVNASVIVPGGAKAATSPFWTVII
ncbi:MAG: hypothetical protein QOH13_882, partial [Thermoleophilaceae bacterium]|nr:hypothetical protein [Thermoleophilaceae bacterium]